MSACDENNVIENVENMPNNLRFFQLLNDNYPAWNRIKLIPFESQFRSFGDSFPGPGNHEL